MLFVPVVQYGGYGRTLAERRIYGHYQLLISAAGNNINTPQLVLSVVFAAVLCAVCANMSKRVALWTGGSVALVAAAGVIYCIWDWHARQACYRAETDEAFADELLSDAGRWQTSAYVRAHYSAQEIAHEIAAFKALAKEKRLLAADNWHIALDFVKEKRARERAQEENLVARSTKPLDVFDQFGEPLTFDDLIPARTATPQKSTTASPANRP